MYTSTHTYMYYIQSAKTWGGGLTVFGIRLIGVEWSGPKIESRGSSFSFLYYAYLR